MSIFTKIGKSIFLRKFDVVNYIETMPEVKIERVVSVSSEDPIFKAENLLKNVKWRCQNNGESQVSVVLQLSKPVKIRLLDLI